MATPNFSRWVGNLDGAKEPLIWKGAFQAGSTQAIEAGEIMEFTGDTNTAWVPIDSDFSQDSNIAIAGCNIISGDLAGYYPIIVPRPGDMFVYDIAAAAATAQGVALGYSDSETVAIGTSHPFGYAVGQQHYPLMQNFAGSGNPSDNGETIKSQSTVILCFTADVSVYSLCVALAN